MAIDVPSVKLLLSEPRMSQVDVRSWGTTEKPGGSRVTPMASSEEEAGKPRSSICDDDIRKRAQSIGNRSKYTVE